MIKPIRAVIFLVAIRIYAAGSSSASCPTNEINLSCQKCDQYCGEPFRYCILVCEAECSCREGYIRSAAHSYACISEKLREERSPESKLRIPDWLKNWISENNYES